MAPIEFPEDEDILRALQLKLRLLDDAFAWARSPKKRKKIERKMAEVEKEIENLKERAKVVDIAYARWKKSFDAMLNEKH
jgi:hypothetical protein